MNNDQIFDKIKKHYSSKAEFIYVFGSILTPRFNQESDVDFAVYFKKRPEARTLLRVLSEASEIFQPRRGDLIILNSTDPIIIMQILQNGKLLLNNNPGLHCQFVAEKISMYLDLKKSREVVEKNLLRGGLHDPT